MLRPWTYGGQVVKIDILPTKSVGLGWEYVNSTFFGDSCIGEQDDGNKENDASIQGIGSIGAGETQKALYKIITKHIQNIRVKKRYKRKN